MDLGDLYRDVIVDHNRSPRNFGVLDPASHTAEGVNPLCGDMLTVYLRVEGDHIADARFEGQGCAISVASASLMTERLKGLSVSDSRNLSASVRHMLTGDGAATDGPELGKLAALGGVREFPSRVKCASLCWHALVAALEHDAAPVSTE